jgi:hypothetical protein
VRRWQAVCAGAGITLVLTACAGRQPPSGVYHSNKGYRLTLPGSDWQPVPGSRADLELRHRQAQAGILVNASCGARLTLRTVNALTREILAGFSGREVHERGVASLAGQEAAHLVVEGQSGPGGDRVRVEIYVARDDRCVYDLLYAAAPEDFPTWRGDFRHMVGTFVLD